ncbi:MAG TPA: hypothetical protein VHM90_10485 [Phycisphaerae bacterium]|jgi:hypothetical protein|nr:hypothetical protein [Phycisphaerae bacterium]
MGRLAVKNLLAICAIACAGATSARADTLGVQYYTVGTFDVLSVPATGNANFGVNNAVFTVTPNGNGSILTITGGGSTTTLTYDSSGVQNVALFSPGTPIPFFGSGSLGDFTLSSDALLLTTSGVRLSVDIFQSMPVAVGATSPQLVGTVSGLVFFNGATSVEGSFSSITFSPSTTVANSVPPVTYNAPGATIVPITASTPTSFNAQITAPDDGGAGAPPGVAPLPSIASSGAAMFGLAALGLIGHRLRKRIAV